jgi:hypothetical protein
VSAWGQSDSEITGALSYLAGICADFVPQNPGICTGVPPTITLVPVPVTETATNGAGRGTRPPIGPPPGGFTIPVTTITVTQTQQGETVTATYTVPQVAFVTAEATGPAAAPGVNLVPAVPAATTAVAGLGSGSGAGAGAGPGAGNGAGAPAPTTAVAPAGAAPTGTASGTRPPAATFTGAASRQSVGFGLLAAVLAVVAFLF